MVVRIITTRTVCSDPGAGSPFRVQLSRRRGTDEDGACCTPATEWPLNGARSTAKMALFYDELAEFRHSAFYEAAGCAFCRTSGAWNITLA